VSGHDHSLSTGVEMKETAFCQQREKGVLF